MTNKEAKNTLCVFYEQILKELWLTREERNGLGEALDLAIKALENAGRLHKWLNPDVDPELALEKIRELVYYGKENDNETDN